MSSHQKVRLLALGCGMAIAVSGFFHYPVTGPVRRWGQGLIRNSGWKISVGRARWVPWSGLDVYDLNFQRDRGGRLQVDHIHIIPEPFSLFLGYLATRWDVGQIQVDPGSWGIQSSPVQDILSSKPVITSGSARVGLRYNRIELERLALEGPLLSLGGEGWWRNEPQLQLAFKFQGRLARLMLESAGLYNGSEKGDLWEPFQGWVGNTTGRVRLSFDSNFFKFHPHGEGS